MTITEAELQSRARNIKLLLLDVDGVLTDGKLYFANSGEEQKAFNILDGLGVKLLQASGVKTGIITGRTSQLVARRAAELGIDILIQKSPDKLASLKSVAQEHNLELDQIAFMGDDYPDLPVMMTVGLALCPLNAHPEVAARSHWQSSKRGGEGAVREACDMLMQAQGSYQAALAQYLPPSST